jgi:ABC-2 type transport system ATP-binding protein
MQPIQQMLLPALRFRHVARRQGGRAVLDGVDLDLPAGTILGLAGINGAGKTTLIRCLLDFCALDAGEIAIAGRPHTEPSARQPLAYLPERFNPPAWLTGREFLAHVRALHALPADRAKAAACAAELGLDEAALLRPVREYSKGMAQKLGLAGTLQLDKTLYVLDEPASGLDPQARALFRRALHARRQAGAAVLMTSHALADVHDLCDTIAILHDGRIRFAGTPAACIERFGTAGLEQAFLAAIA